MAVAGRGGVVVGNRYESYEAWRAVAGVGTAIAVGTMLARPPAAATVVAYGGSSYYYDSGTYSSDYGSYDSRSAVAPVYKNPGKNFRLKRGAVGPWAKSTSPYYGQTLDALARHYGFTTGA